MFSSRFCARLGVVAAGAVLTACLGVLYAYSPRQAAVVLSAAPVRHAPSFRLQDLDGQPYDSQSLRGKAVVVFFNSTRCSTCDDYQPRVRDLARQYQHDPRVQFLAMNQDVSAGDDQRLLEVRVIAKMADHPFPTLLDLGARTAARFGARPAQFAVLDHVGRVRYLGSFDDSRDRARVTRRYVAEELRRAIDDIPPTSIAAR